VLNICLYAVQGNLQGHLRHRAGVFSPAAPARLYPQSLRQPSCSRSGFKGRTAAGSMPGGGSFCWGAPHQRGGALGAAGGGTAVEEEEVEEGEEGEGGVLGADYYIVGAITGAHGIKGEVRVKTFTDFPERLTGAGERWLQMPGNPLTGEEPKALRVEVVKGRWATSKGQEGYIVKLKGVNSRNQAEALKGASILVGEEERDREGELGEGEFYITDLVGCEVVLQGAPSGSRVGVVTEVVSDPQSLLKVRMDLPPLPSPDTGADGQPVKQKRRKKPTAWIPLVPEIVPDVDLANNIITITPPEGLLELNMPSDKPKKAPKRRKRKARRSDVKELEAKNLAGRADSG